MNERGLSEQWRRLHQGEALRGIRVRFPGWPNGEEGPDFLHALIEVDGRMVCGDVEIDRRQRDWKAHGHDRNPRFNRVVLHVVGPQETLLGPVKTLNGHWAPTVALTDQLPRFRWPSPSMGEDRVGLEKEWREILERGGWARFHAKVARMRRWIEQWGAEEALYRGVLDAYGYAKFRIPFKQLAEAVPLRKVKRCATARKLEEAYLQVSAGLAWAGAHVRPVNRPEHRIKELSAVLAAHRGSLRRSVEQALNASHPRRGLARVAARSKGLGERMAVNVILPWLAAVHPPRSLRADLARRWYREWPALEGNAVTRRVSRRIFGRTSPRLTALTQQGLHWIDRHPDVLLQSA